MKKPTFTTSGYAAQNAQSPLAAFQFQRRAVDEHDVHIHILYCGVCHSDLHQVRDEWGGTVFPVVPGHEIIGRVVAVGKKVTRFAIGDTVGVGCLVDSCRICVHCKENLEQYCDTETIFTYNSADKHLGGVTYGGYSRDIVVDQNYVLSVSEKLNPAAAAPLLCAGITTYSPLRHWRVGKGDRVGIVGLGGLGHMAVKIAAAMGAEVTMLSSARSKAADAQKLGADHFVLSSDIQQMAKHTHYFDLILNTVAAPHCLDDYLNLIKCDGTMVMLGIPNTPHPSLQMISLIQKRRKLSGSLIGGIAETQEMLDFCATHNITSEIELIPIDYINQAYERMLKSDVKYRFVIDIASLSA